MISMFHRSAVIWLLLLLGLQSLGAEDRVPVSLRALREIVEEPVMAATSMARKGVLSDEEADNLRLTIPSRTMQLWMDLVPALEANAAKPREHEDIFPPELAAALKDDAEVRMKAGNLRASLKQLEDLAEAVATPGEKPDERKVTVPRTLVDTLYLERQALVLQALEQWEARVGRNQPTILRQNGGTFARFGDGAYHKVADADVPEEGPVFTAPYGEKGTWNLYQVINRPTTWVQAEAAAVKMAAPYGDKKIVGHLVSIRSYPENMFVTRLARGMWQTWIGLNDRRIECGKDALGPWEWTSGEPVDYRRWKSGEPNGSGYQKQTFDEDGGTLYRESDVNTNGYWGDYPAGNEVEEARRFPYVVEWNLNAPEPPKGAALPEPILPVDLKGPEGGDGVFGVRIAYGCGSCSTMRSAVESYQSGSGRIVEEKLSTLHHHEPDDRGWVELFGEMEPFPGQKAKEVDKDMTIFCRGRIRIAEAGTYTFGIHHDDGFALRIKGAKWKKTTGLCCIDPADPATISHYFPCGNGTSHGIAELAAGDYDLEFFGFQGTGQSYFELYAAKGEFSGDLETDTWRLVGHKSRGKLPMLGIAAPGWEIEVTPPGALSAAAFDAADRAIGRKGRKLAEPSPIVAYFDPDGHEDYHPGPCVPFPDGKKGEDDNFFVLRAKATLEVPADGKYWIGYFAANSGRLIVEGQRWQRVVIDGPGDKSLDEDVLQNKADNWYGERVLGELELKAGKYPIEYLGVHGKGTWAWDFVHCAAPGLPVRALRVGAAGMVDDRDGLQLVK